MLLSFKFSNEEAVKRPILYEDIATSSYITGDNTVAVLAGNIKSWHSVLFACLFILTSYMYIQA